MQRPFEFLAEMQSPPKFREFQRIATLVPVEVDGDVIPAGTRGSIVDVCKTPDYFEVEFAQPFHAVVTLHISQIKE